MASKSIIGIDTHIASCNYCCISEKTGEILGAGDFSTNTTNFIKTVSKFPKPRVIIVEQGPLSDWIERILESFVEEVVVADTKRNSWIARDPLKNDDIDGEKLAILYLGGYIKQIVSRSKLKRELISLVLHHNDLTKHQTRLKNQISAKFRQGGNRKAGKAAYKEETIQNDLICLSYNKALQLSVNDYSAQLRVVEKHIEETSRQMQKLSNNYPEIEMLDAFPGIGFVGSVTLSALIDTPERFPTLKKLWIYCGYGLDRPSSAGKGKPRITKRHNRIVKKVIGIATNQIISICKNNNKYTLWYLNNLKQGKDHKKLKATIARKLIKDIWIEWKKFNAAQYKKAA